MVMAYIVMASNASTNTPALRSISLPLHADNLTTTHQQLLVSPTPERDGRTQGMQGRLARHSPIEEMGQPHRLDMWAWAKSSVCRRSRC